MLMRWTEGVETDDVDSFAFASVGRILGYDLAERNGASRTTRKQRRPTIIR